MPIHRLCVVEQKTVRPAIGREKGPVGADVKKRTLDYETALSVCLESAGSPVETETVALEQSLGRVLRKDMVCDVFVPPFDRATVDGYAVRSIDLRNAASVRPVKLELAGAIPAGFMAKRALSPGETLRIMAGAPVPKGADAVVKMEVTSCWDVQTVMFYSKVGDNDHIVSKGRDLQPGQVMVRAGETVTPAMVGILAAGGASRVPVSRSLRVGIISTGSELIDAGSAQPQSGIHNVNGYALFALANAAGAVTVNFGSVMDSQESLRKRVDAALGMDILLLSGGVSSGAYDIVRETLKQAGVTDLLPRVNVKPGKPLFFGKKDRTLVFGLPGNPVSSFVNFHLFVRPVIARLAGKSRCGLRNGQAKILAGRILRPGPRSFLRAKLKECDAGLWVDIPAEQRAGAFSPMMDTDVLVDVPENTRWLKENEKVRVLYL